jgi:predicted amidohydrolase
MIDRSLAAAQLIPVRGEVEANVAGHIRLIRAAAEAGAGVLVSPELSLTGYELDLAAELAFVEGDARLGPLIEAAAAHEMTIVVGAPVRIQSQLHIGAFIVAPNGSVEVYTKHHLGAFPPEANPGGAVPPAEASVFQPGDRNPLVRMGGHTAAVAVCADIGRPAHAEQAAARGADTYLASMFVIPGDLAPDTARLRQYAARHAMAVVFSNFGGPTGGLPSGGSSAIFTQQGELVAQLPPAGEGIVIAAEDENGWRGEPVVLG